MTLFMGCRTGKNLRAAFGDLCEEIYWEEVSKEIGGHSSSAFPADHDHIRTVITEQNPDIVLCFGKIATEAVRVCYQGPCLEFPHPAARFVTSAMLKEWGERFEGAKQDYEQGD